MLICCISSFLAARETGFRRTEMGLRHFVQIEYNDAGDEIFRKEWSSQKVVKQRIYWKEFDNED